MKWIEKRRPREPPKRARTAKVGMNFFVPSNMNELAQFMARELGKEADEIIATVLAEEGQAEKKRLGERLDRASNYADDIFSRVKDNINWAVYENAGTSSENSHALRFGYVLILKDLCQNQEAKKEKTLLLYSILERKRERNSKVIYS